MASSHSRRVLVIGAPGSPVLDIVKDLTGSVPPSDGTGSVAGSSHEWHVKTEYYETTVPVWIDEIANVEQWQEEFMKEEAKEVIEAVGAYIYCFHLPANGEISSEIEQTLSAVQAIVEEHAGYDADNVMLAVGMPAAGTDGVTFKQDDWDDLCIAKGFEFILYGATGTNEYGERQGFERMQEALEANEWSAVGGEADELDLEDLDLDAADDLEGGFGSDEAQMTAELYGLKAALAGWDNPEQAEDFVPREKQAGQVDDLDKLMGKLLHVKEQSAGLPEAQRKQMAAKAVRELMDDTSGV
jgi:alpha- and gamma-adaptin-binding protein p34